MERDSFKRLALILSGVIVLVSAGSALTLATGTDWSGGLAAISSPAWALLPAIFATGGALIVSNRPRNVIGWLLLGPAVGMTLSGIMTITGYLELPRDSLTPGLFFALWYDNLTWLMLIFPLIHLLAVFPTGSPLSGRWR